MIDISRYKNDLDFYPMNILTERQIRKQVMSSVYPRMSYNSNAESVRKVNEEIIGGARVPTIVRAFKELIALRGRIPTWEDFWGYYQSKCPEKLLLALNKDDEHNFKARISKTYGSSIREVHAPLLIRDSGIFDYVFTDERIDFRYHIDIVGVLDDTHYYINVMLNTSRSLNSLKRKKTLRGHNETWLPAGFNLNRVSLVVNPNGDNEIFFPLTVKNSPYVQLYGYEHIEELKSIVYRRRSVSNKIS